MQEYVVDLSSGSRASPSSTGVIRCGKEDASKGSVSTHLAASALERREGSIHPARLAKLRWVLGTFEGLVYSTRM